MKLALNVVIHCTTKQQAKKVCSILFPDNKNEWVEYWEKYKNQTGYGESHYCSISWYEQQYSYTIITFEEFMKTQPAEKKIIGYKTPFDMFNGDVPKGTIYKTDKYNRSELTNCIGCDLNAKHNIPAEIVETWEPIYEQSSKTLVLGSNRISILIKNGVISADGKIFNLKELTDIEHEMRNGIPDGDLSGFKVTYPSITIGCSTFSVDELALIIKTAKEQL